MHAKWLRSCAALCGPMEHSPPGFSCACCAGGRVLRVMGQLHMLYVSARCVLPVCHSAIPWILLQIWSFPTLPTTPSFLLPAANYTVFKLKVTYPRRHEGSRCDIRLRHHLHLSWHQLSGCLPPIPLPQEAKVSMHTRQPGDVLSLKQSPSTRGPMGRVCPGWGDSSPESPDTPTPQAAPCSVRPISALLLQAWTHPYWSPLNGWLLCDYMWSCDCPHNTALRPTGGQRAFVGDSLKGAYWGRDSIPFISVGLTFHNVRTIYDWKQGAEV